MADDRVRLNYADTYGGGLGQAETAIRNDRRDKNLVSNAN